MQCRSVTRSFNSRLPASLDRACLQAAVDASEVLLVVKPKAITPSANSISSIVLMPVERIILSVHLATSNKNGAFVSSPDPILIVESLRSETKNLRLSMSNGVERNSIPLALQYSNSSRCWVCDNSRRCNISSCVSWPPVCEI
ncbi:unannotated protein [freshwater metagenome]|uniref:Unannotated protein n=1 Tax=freshwater metagenome TaxID=449393 RepID=A0A6J6YDC7_9ZZZZ